MGSIPGLVIPKTLKMVPVATLLGAQHYVRQALASLLPKQNIASLTSHVLYEQVRIIINKGPKIINVCIH